MNTNDMNTIEHFKDTLVQELQSFASSRRNDVARGAETPELAALIVEKYAIGVKAAIAAAIQVFEFRKSDFDGYEIMADHLCIEIDPQWAENRKFRWEARPAGISKAGAEEPVF